MNSQLHLVSNFISDMLNFNKSSVMWFSGNRKKMADYPPIVVDGVTLKVVDKQNYLGIIFDPSLSWAIIKSPRFIKRWHTIFTLSVLTSVF